MNVGLVYWINACVWLKMQDNWHLLCRADLRTFGISRNCDIINISYALTIDWKYNAFLFRKWIYCKYFIKMGYIPLILFKKIKFTIVLRSDLVEWNSSTTLYSVYDQGNLEPIYIFLRFITFKMGHVNGRTGDVKIRLLQRYHLMLRWD